MIDSRPRRTRASSRDSRNGDGVRASAFELLLKYLGDRFARSAMLRVEHGVHDVVRWMILRLILGLTGAALLSAGLLLLLGAEVKGLEALGFPLWLACLSAGVTVLLVALLALKDILWPGEEKDVD